MTVPKTVKYLLCYLPFILIGTALVVFGLFRQGSARIALLIVGIVVLFSGLFAWCTDSDVGCLVVCSCWTHKERKSKKSSKSTVQAASAPVEIFTIHNTRIDTQVQVGSPQTTLSKKTKKVSSEQQEVQSYHEDDEEFHERKMIQRERHQQYGKHSLHTAHHVFDEEHHTRAGGGGGGGGGGGRKPRYPTRAPSLDNFLNTYKPNGIHGRHETRLTIKNIQKLDKMRQHHSSLDSDRLHEAQRYNSMNRLNEGFEIDIALSMQKRESIKNWITSVHNSREDLAQVPDSPTHQLPPGAPWGLVKGYDSDKIIRKPLPAVPPMDGRASSLVSGSEVISMSRRSFGSDGNKSVNGTIGSPQTPRTAQEFDLDDIMVRRSPDGIRNERPKSILEAVMMDERPSPPRSILEAVIMDQYV